MAVKRIRRWLMVAVVTLMGIATLSAHASRFNSIDTAFVEPQHYNFTVMLKSITSYEIYTLTTSDDRSIHFSPRPHVKVGPYIGWRWLLLGYTIDFSHVDLTNDGRTRFEYDMSLYSSMLGVDLYYRKTGNDYRISSIDLGDEYDAGKVKGADFDGLTSSIKGFNLYYIFNHRRFSYPAAFSQSTVQRRSAGSPLVGIGYTRHKVSLDWDRLDQVVEERMGTEIPEELIDSTMRFSTVRYTDISVSGGWAYNWVFARNWLFAVSVSGALGYQRYTGDTESKSEHFRERMRDFSNNKVTVDGIFRLGLVWNNSKWYAGASSVLNSYNYRRSDFSINNTFGTVNVYVGFNFGRHSASTKKALQK